MLSIEVTNQLADSQIVTVVTSDDNVQTLLLVCLQKFLFEVIVQ